MRGLITVHFKTRVDADTARDNLMALPALYLHDVADAVIVTVEPYGDFRLDQKVNFWSTKRDTLSLLKLIRWTLFVQPLLAIIPDNVATQLRDALSDFGISPCFASGLQTALDPNRAALVLMVRVAHADFLIKHIAPLATSSVMTPLDDVFDTNLHTALIGALDAIKTHHADAKNIIAP